ncbi:MAG TPA: hypothetical protein VFT31_15235 [Kribbella sp.]|nr:hypothetical protein [Kribbella sp.]
MRDNGLTAAEYTSMGGIDPLVAEPVLAALAEAGIAAYAAAPDATDGTGEGEGDGQGQVPGQVREEMFVDSASAERARAVIERSTEDAEWKSLVEQFNAPSAPGHAESPVPAWPASEDVDETAYEPLIDVPSGLIVGDDPVDEEEEEEQRPARVHDPHDHYIPPEPPRGPRLDWISRAAWLGVIGGPVLVLLAAIFNFGASRITVLAVLGFAAGFLTLVIRMKDRLPGDDSGDDGAVV